MMGVDKVQLPEVEPSRLILHPSEIFDTTPFVELLKRGSYSDSQKKKIRSETIKIISSKLVNGQNKIKEAGRFDYLISPFASLKLVRSYAYITDCIVQLAMDFSTNILNGDKPLNENFSVMGVGGYGRGEMAPHSDVDILFLISESPSNRVNIIIENALYLMWDLKLKVGHSVRSQKDCLHYAKEDLTIRTALLESRFVWGHRNFAVSLHDLLWNNLFKNTGPNYVEDKLQERNSRYERQGGNRYLLEPNVKESKGGLRDLQTLYWIVKYLYRISDIKDLIELEVITIEEFERFMSAEAFLWAVRCELHDLANRPQDVLHFEAQYDVAKNLGYKDNNGRKAVEVFMQDYFRFATDVGDLARILFSKLEAQHKKKVPVIQGWFRRTRSKKVILPPEYTELHGRMTISDPASFLKDPLNILRLFEVGLATQKLLHPDAMRLISANLHLIDRKFRNDPEANKIFMDTLLNYGNPERVLRRMNELGVLGRFIPEFGPIVAMMQYNLYHHYTVDEHTIQCLTFLAKIEKGELKENLPIVTEILKKGINRKVLYVALLLHDCGKGSGQDHSQFGARQAAKAATRLGLDQQEVELVVWLIQKHLVMSDTSQKRDIGDPKTVLNFARIVGSRTRLKLLTVLTVCDIHGVGPGVWNDWKAHMLRGLYKFTHTALSEGSLNFASHYSVSESQNLAQQILQKNGLDHSDETLSRHTESFWQNLETDEQIKIIELLNSVEDEKTVFEFTQDEKRGATRVCFVRKSVPGLFPRLAGILALAKTNIVDAKSFLTKDGFVTTLFWLQDLNGKPYEMIKLSRVKGQINKFINNFALLDETLAKRDSLKDSGRLSKGSSRFVVPTEITFDNDGSDLYTIIEVDTYDRSGLLYELVNTLHKSNLSVVSATIATYGAQAVDVFYVKNKSGLKILNPSRLDQVKKQLLNAIEA